ncbi:flagellin [Desulfotalea psychrophila]
MTGSVAAGTIQVNGNDVGAATNNKELAAAISAADSSVEAKAVNNQSFDFNTVNLSITGPKTDEAAPLARENTTVSLAITDTTDATTFAVDDLKIGAEAAAAITDLNLIAKGDATALAAAISDIDGVTAETTNSTVLAWGVTTSSSGMKLTISDAADANPISVDVATGTDNASVDDVIAAFDDIAGYSAVKNVAGTEITITSEDGKAFNIKQTQTDGASVLAGGFTALPTATAVLQKANGVDLTFSGEQDIVVETTTAGAVALDSYAGATYNTEAPPAPAVDPTAPTIMTAVPTDTLVSGDLTIGGEEIITLDAEKATLVDAINTAAVEGVTASLENKQSLAWAADVTLAVDASYKLTLETDGGVAANVIIGGDVDSEVDAGDVAAAINETFKETEEFKASVDVTTGNLVIESKDGATFNLTEFTNNKADGSGADTALTSVAGLVEGVGGAGVDYAATAVNVTIANDSDVTIAMGAGADIKVGDGLVAGVYEVPAPIVGNVASTGGESSVTGPLNAGDLTINGEDVGAVEGDAAAIAAQIQKTDADITATATNSQTVKFDEVKLGADGSYTLQIGGAEIAVATTLDAGDDAVSTDDDTHSVTSQNVIAAINKNADGFSAIAELDKDDKETGNIIITKAGGSNFTLNEDIDSKEAAANKIGLADTVADGRDLRGTVSLESDTSIIIAGDDPSKAGLEAGRVDPGVVGDYNLTLTGDDGTEFKVDMSSAKRDGHVTAEDVATAINSDAATTAKFSAKVDEDGQLQVSRNDGSSFKITEMVDKDGDTKDDGVITDGLVGVDNAAKKFVGQVEIDSPVDVTLTGSGLKEAGLNNIGNGSTTIDKLDILTRDSANTAITSVDEALMDIDQMRGKLGAVQNRFTSTISNLNNVSENLSAARSRILDTDIAKETSEMTKQNILQQAGVSILAQAKQAPQMALSLIK